MFPETERQTVECGDALAGHGLPEATLSRLRTVLSGEQRIRGR